MSFKSICLLSIAVVSVIIVLQNTQTVSFTILFWSISVSRIILIPFLILLGLVAGYIAGRKKL